MNPTDTIDNKNDLELVDLKRKNYRMSKKNKNFISQNNNEQLEGEEEEIIFLGGKKNNDDIDSNINNLKKNKMTKQKNVSILHRIDTFLDLNLKFDSLELENAFKTSYLSVTRSIYIKYLFYLIIFTVSWLLYLTINSNNQVDITQKFASINSYQSDESNSSILITLESQSQNTLLQKSFLISYLILITLIYIGIFIFLVAIEFKENEYKKIENKLSRQELETKVDFKIAEKDLKLAMRDVLDKEKHYKDLRKKHEQDSVLVSKLRTMHKRCSYPTALFILALMFILCFLIFILQSLNQHTYVSQTTHFIWFTETILLFYLIYPFQLLVPVFFGILFSVLFELFTIRNQFNNETSANVYLHSQIIIFVFIKILLHTSLHLVSGYLKLSLDSIKRDTFMKLAHMNKTRMASQQDKQITERMIKSIMPPLFTHVFGKPEEFKRFVNRVDQMRPLFIYPVSEISILFADIVGFTKMSSKKTAEELVFLLNDLYGRFDKLCEQAGCEKISTLGDCYYCVSGCLNGRGDHAKCCVEMGLLMVKEIEIFNKDHDVDVNMRVGVHTGNALCGFIGGKRFRFDVWSSDVTLANKMESSGRAGWVHISEDTFKKLDGKFNTEPGEKYSGKSTYFVIRESKRETVADALKLSETMNSKKTQDETVVEQESTMQSLITVDPHFNTLSDENLLVLATKEIQFFNPDINFFTMRFNKNEENKFQGYLMGMNHENNFKNKKFWSNPRNLLFISILISFIVNLCVSTAFFLTFIVSTLTQYKYTPEYKMYFITILILYVVLFLGQSVFLFVYFMKSLKTEVKSENKNIANGTTLNSVESRKENAYAQLKLRKKILVKYILVHILSFIFLTAVPIYILTTGLPFLCNLNGFLWNSLLNDQHEKRLNLFCLYLYFIYTISLVNFCSFVQLSSLFRTCLAFGLAVVFGVCGFIGLNPNINEQITIINSNFNQSQLDTPLSTVSFSFYTTLFVKGFLKQNLVSLLDLGLLILLIWFINRQSELIQRISFKCDQEAFMKITHAKEQKELANWLIDIVIPAHVISHVKEKKQYSQNYDCVGVLFVSLCNFSEFFEESYEGGRELLRVLNEISIDFDRLFDEPKYKNVEKIKSIGSTFMIASGLSTGDNKTDDNSNSHLYDLLDFALELNEKLEAFNIEAMSVCHFKFQMKMGFNCGPLTAGVIGTDRLLYDIWGDTVNVASRMDSTGQAGFLQTPEKVARMLGDDYKFQQRGLVQIKGKDQMMTYWLDPKENKKHNQN